MTYQDENFAPNTFLEIKIVNAFQNMCLATRTKSRLSFFMSCCTTDAIHAIPFLLDYQHMENMDTMPPVV